MISTCTFIYGSTESGFMCRNANADGYTLNDFVSLSLWMSPSTLLSYLMDFEEH